MRVASQLIPSYDAFFLTPTTFTVDQADAARNDLMVSLSNMSTTITSCQSTILAAKAYMNLILHILYSTSSQTMCIENDDGTDAARLDLNLKPDLKISSNTGAKNATFTSVKRALNHEFIMATACLSIATGSLGCTYCDIGSYESAALQFQSAASVWRYYCSFSVCHDDNNNNYSCTLPRRMEEANIIPVSMGAAESMIILNLAYAQQMSVASTLCNDEKNSKKLSMTFGCYDNHLMAKLTLGIAEQLDKVFLFEDQLKEEQALIDKRFIQMLYLQKQVQSVLSKYFLACAVWEDSQGCTFATTLMKEVEKELGHCQILHRSSSLQYNHSSSLQDIASFKAHVRNIHCIWQQHVDKNCTEAGGQQPKIPPIMLLQSGVILYEEPDPYNIREDPSFPPITDNLNETSSKSPGYNTATIEVTTTTPNPLDELYVL